MTEPSLWIQMSLQSTEDSNVPMSNGLYIHICKGTQNHCLAALSLVIY